MKRFLGTMMAIAVMSSLLAGCGGSAGENAAASTSSSAQSAGTQSVASAENVTVTIMHHMSEDPKRNALKAWTDEVTKQNSNIQFEVTNITDVDQYRNTLKTKLAAGDPPDIMGGNASQYKDLIEAGHIADLTSAPFIKNCDDNAVKGLTLNGKTYGIPVDIGALVVYYNKDVFSSTGVSVPTTYEEYLKVCQTFKDKNIVPNSFGFKDAWTANVETQMDYWPDMAKEPDLFKDSELRAKKFSDFAGFKRAMERVNQRLAFATGDVLGTDHNTALQEFATGKAAMTDGGTWDISSIRAANKDGNFGVFALPADKAEDTLMRISVDDAWMIADKAKNKDAAFTFFNYATSPEGGKVWAETTATISAFKGVDSSSLDPMTQDVSDIISSGKVINSDTLYILSGQMSTYLDQWGQEFVADSKRNVDEYIAKLDKQFDTIAKTN